MSVKGKTISVNAPSAYGFFIKGLANISSPVWTLKFKCGECGAKPTVQHVQSNNWHKCPVCKTVNILDKWNPM